MGGGLKIIPDFWGKLDGTPVGNPEEISKWKWGIIWSKIGESPE